MLVGVVLTAGCPDSTDGPVPVPDTNAGNDLEPRAVDIGAVDIGAVDIVQTDATADIENKPDTPAAADEGPEPVDAVDPDIEENDDAAPVTEDVPAVEETDEPDVIAPPDVPIDPAIWCTEGAQLDLYEKRIEPLVNGSKPSSCNQCHLSGMDLSMYAKGTPCKTMACMKANEVVDFDDPEASEVLAQILQAEPQSALITEKVIDDEYQGFLEWIEFSAVCHDLVCGDVESPCADPDAPVPAEPGVLTPLGGCAEETLLATWTDKVFEWRSRCHGCHSNCKPDYAAPCWLIDDFDKNDPEQLALASMQSMYNVIGMSVIDVQEPLKSLFLTKPASKTNLGGVTHGGGDKFYDASDDAYQDFRDWLFVYSSCYLGQEPQLPEVTLSKPKQKQKFYGKPVTLVGSAVDPQDGVVKEQLLEWKSSKGGVMAVGGGPHTLDLALGKHIITLTAKDKDGNANTRSVKIWVKAPP